MTPRRARQPLPVRAAARQPGLAAGRDLSPGGGRLHHATVPRRGADRAGHRCRPNRLSLSAYTGMADRSVPGQGDIRALEGTRVTIHATANHDIQRAEIDLDCSGRHGVSMTAAGKTATGTLTLALDADDPSKPQHESYQLLFTDAKGHGNTRPIRYRIEVIRDLPPGVKFTSPEQEEVQVPADGRLEIGVWAQDRDFALRRVALRAEHDGRSLSIPPLLDKPAPEKPWPGQFQKTYAFEPARLGLRAGDHVAYWAEAEDNKEPTANHSETGHRTILVTAIDGAAPDAGPQPHPAHRRLGPLPGDHEIPPQAEPNPNPTPDDPQNKGEQKTGERPEGGNQDSTNAGEKQDQAANKPENQPGQSGQSGHAEEAKPNASDGTDDASAMDEILKQRENQSGGEGKPSEQKQPGANSSENQQKPPGGEGKPNEQKQPGANSPENQQKQPGGEGKPNEQKQPGANSSENQQKQPGGEGKPNDQKQPGANSSENQRNQPGGEGKSNEQKQPGANSSENQPNQPGGEGKSSGQEKPGANPQQNEQKSAGAKQPGGNSGQQATEKRPDNQSPSGSEEKLATPSPNSAQKPAAKPGGDKTAADAQRLTPASEKPKGEPQSPDSKPRQSGETQSQQSPVPGRGQDQQTAAPRRKPTARLLTGSPTAWPTIKGGPETSPKSPDTSTNKSDTKGQTSGDQAGAGEEGGGMRTARKGVGTAGSQSPADEGSAQAPQKGQGDTGTGKGDQVKADHKTGSSAKQSGTGAGQTGQQPGGEGAGKTPDGQQAKNAPPGGADQGGRLRRHAAGWRGPPARSAERGQSQIGGQPGVRPRESARGYSAALRRRRSQPRICPQADRSGLGVSPRSDGQGQVEAAGPIGLEPGGRGAVLAALGADEAGGRPARRRGAGGAEVVGRGHQESRPAAARHAAARRQDRAGQDRQPPRRRPQRAAPRLGGAGPRLSPRRRHWRTVGTFVPLHARRLRPRFDSSQNKWVITMQTRHDHVGALPDANCIHGLCVTAEGRCAKFRRGTSVLAGRASARGPSRSQVRGYCHRPHRSFRVMRPAQPTSAVPSADRKREMERLIDAVASRNEAPKLVGEHPLAYPIFGEKFDWKDQDRVQAAAWALAQDETNDLWGCLMEHVGDKRYSATCQLDECYPENYEVGVICEMIAQKKLLCAYLRHLEPGKTAHYGGPTRNNVSDDTKDFIPGSVQFELHYVSYLYDADGLAKWYHARKGKPLYELQIEMCEWAVKKVEDAHGVAEKPKKEFIAAVRKEIESLKKSRKPVVDPSPWASPMVQREWLEVLLEGGRAGGSG